MSDSGHHGLLQAAHGERPKRVRVCVCTYGRPALLARCLATLGRQETGDRFTYSIVVADNDGAESARQVVRDFATHAPVPVHYCVEPQRNIALARNRALAGSDEEFIAFIDDDELAGPRWLATLLHACEHLGVDGVLGPVRPHFDQAPPRWLIRGRFCERPEHATGLLLDWRQTRTGNVLLRRPLLEGIAEPFRREFGGGGEDQDFFRRLIARGHRFAWCNEAVVHEVIGRERWTRTYLLRRALLRGQNERLLLNSRSLLSSVAAVPAYAAVLPLLAPFGQHLVMRYAVRLCDHAGKLLAACGLQPLGRTYPSN